MADWSNLKSSINSVIKTNGEQEITGQVLQNVLNTIVSNLGENATFVDVATPTTNPGAPDGNVFYIAYTVGTYSNFNGIVLNANEVAILLWNGSWTKKIVGLATAESLSNLHTTLTNIVSKLKASTGYLICSTGENTAAKTIAQTNFELSTNCRLIVKMINHNMAASPTLNVNNTGAKPLYYNGMIAGVDNTWESGEVLDVYYDGTNYQASNIQGGVGIGGNQILEWTTDAATTRLQVMQRKRKKGMSITYVNDKNETVNEQYINKIFTDAEWKKRPMVETLRFIHPIN